MTGFPVGRPRSTRVFGAVFVVFYLFMVGLNSAIGSREEIYPFFGWALFSRTPAWEQYDTTVVLHAIDGEPVDGLHYLIPSESVSDKKVLRRAVTVCRSDPAECRAAVDEWLAPVVRRLVDERSAEFSIVVVRVDLHAALRAAPRLADRTARITDFARPTEVLGRFTTSP